MNRFFFIAILVLFVHHAYCSQDSAKASKAGASPAPTEKLSSPQQPAKTTAIEKNAAVEEEDILIDETEEKKSAKNAPAPAQSDTAMNAEKSASPAVDSQTIVAPGKEQNPVSQPAAVAHDSSAVKEAPQPEKPAVPIIVEAVHSINFAKILKNYRSPKMAMLLSLLVPGLGQAYVKQYVKTGIFVALEATAIGFGIAFNNKGKKQFDQATSFANDNYDYDKMKGYYDGLYDFLFKLEGSTDNADSAAHAQLDMIYTDSLHSFIKGSQEYYNTIKEQSFVQGWRDCEPSAGDIFTNTADTIRVGNNIYIVDDASRYLLYRPNSAGKIDTNERLYGYSPNQNRYIDMVSKSNNYYKTAQGIFFTLIINHILSAVDALISAKAYNDALLGKESFWQHLSIEQQVVKAGPSPSAGFSMRIQF